MGKIAVIALGGNSLIKDNKISFDDQIEVVKETCTAIAEIIESGYRVIITHGNGPQVGFNLLRSDIAKAVLPIVPMDICVAETQGSIGYIIQQSLLSEFIKRKIRKDIVTIITQVEIAPDDPSFHNPTKPIGTFYTKDEALKLSEQYNWTIKEDAGRGYRRVVPSPKPIKIVEIESIKALINTGAVVITVGGGGIPVINNQEIMRVDAVIDKDRASSLLASEIDADLLLLSTGVKNVSLNYGAPNQIDLEILNIDTAKEYLQNGQFPAGSMGPKIEAAISFLEKGGERVIITSPGNLGAALNNNVGTHFIK